MIFYIGYDTEYNKGNKIEKILEKDINALSFLEIITYLKFIQRKVYYDGYDKVINEYLENGTVKKLLERYLELC